MIKKFSKEERNAVYERLVSYATACVKHGNGKAAFYGIKAATRWAYHFNWMYADRRIDDLTRQIGRLWAEPFEVKQDLPRRYLLIDTHGIDNRGLTQQYLRALIAMNAKILFVSIEPNVVTQRDIRTELAAYTNADTLYLDNKKMSPRQRLNILVEKVKQYQPQVALGHIFPWDPISFMLFDLAQGMKVYNINFTDHAFWMGSSIIDYNIEFRAYGMTLSLEKRGLRKEQLISLPYYPIKPLNEPFYGFPELPDGAVKIFSGGSFYKMMGEDDRYFKLCDRLLDISPRVVLLIAGPGDDSLVRQKIAAMSNAHRVYLIGDRRDINEVFKHCDLYLNTYPLGGGLMSQYAVDNAKPLLTLGKEGEVYSQIEGIVNHFANNVRTFTDMEELLTYAKHCIDDETFRKEEGLKNKAGLMTEERFNTILAEILSGKHVDYFHWEKMDVNYKSVEDLYLDVENNYLKSAFHILLANLRLRFFKIFPQYIFYAFSVYLKKVGKILLRK